MTHSGPVKMNSSYCCGKTLNDRGGQAFESLGYAICNNPVRLISAIFLFTVLCATGFSNFSVQSGTDLWVPANSQAKIDRAYVENVYGEGSHQSEVLFSGNNMIDKMYFDQMWDLHDILSVLKSGDESWLDACAQKDMFGKCFTHGPTQFWSNNRTLYDQVVHKNSDLIKSISVTTYPNGVPVSRDLLFGKYEVDEDDQVISAEGVVQYYAIQMDDEDAYDWMHEFLVATGHFPFHGGNIYYFSGRSLNDELERSVGGDIMLIIVTFSMMICFTCLVMTKKSGPRFQTRVGLSICGIFLTVLAIIAGYGLCSGMGIPFNTLHSVLPFIIIAIGVDDMFVIAFSFDHQPDSLRDEVRLAKALRKCGLSITYTTATDLAAFILGASSSLPAIKDFCLYTVCTLLINFIFQLTAFCLLLVWDAKRRRKGNMDILFCIPTSGGDTVSKIVPIDSDGDSDDRVVPPPFSPTGIPITPIVQKSAVDEPAELDTVQHFLGNVYYPIISNFNVRIAITVVFVAVLGTSMWATSNISQGFDLGLLVPDDSYALEYIREAKRLDLFVIESTISVDIYFKDIEYHQPEVQQKILKLEQDFVALPHNSGPVSSWLGEFLPWYESHQLFNGNNTNNQQRRKLQRGGGNGSNGGGGNGGNGGNGQPPPPPPSNNNEDDGTNDDAFIVNFPPGPAPINVGGKDEFYGAIQEFVSLPKYYRFKDDIIFRCNGDYSVKGIVDSRISAFHRDLSDPMDQVRTMQNARKVCKNAGLSPHAFPYAFPYILYETEVVIVKEMYENLLMALAAVAVVSSFVLILPRAVLFVCVMLCVIDTDILGTMYLWDLTINTVTVVQLVMAVGLVVDYVAHILHCYLGQPKKFSRSERVRLALIEIGPSVLMGCTTTFLGILPMAFASSEVFRIFFRMFFAIIVFGSGHGLILMPAILPWISFGEERIEDEDERYDEVPEVPLAKTVDKNVSDLSVPDVDVPQATVVKVFDKKIDFNECELVEVLRDEELHVQ